MTFDNPFDKRIKQHDTSGLAVVKQIVEKHGGKVFDSGVENLGNLSSELRNRFDSLSINERFKPDCVVSHPSGLVAYTEIKTTGIEKPNYSIEATAFYAATRRVIERPYEIFWMTFTISGNITAKAIMTKDMPSPKTIYFPDRYDVDDSKERISRYFPDAKFKDTPPPRFGSGSGTPYFLFPKHHNGLIDFDIFLDNKIRELQQNSNRHHNIFQSDFSVFSR